MKKYFYRSIFLAIATIVTLNNSAPAQSDEALWIPANVGKDGSIYLDANSITEQGNTKTFTIYVSVKQPNPEGWTNIKAKGVANCSTKYSVYEQVKAYDSENNLVKALPTDSVEKLNIGAENMAEFVCNLD